MTDQAIKPPAIPPPTPAAGSGTRHPWKLAAANYLKLKEARKIAKQRRERGGLHREWHRENYRLKHDIPIESPVMTPAEACAKARAARLKRLVRYVKNQKRV